MNTYLFLIPMPAAILIIFLGLRDQIRDWKSQKIIHARLSEIAQDKVLVHDQFCRCRTCKPPFGENIYLTAPMFYGLVSLVIAAIGLLVYYYAH